MATGIPLDLQGSDWNPVATSMKQRKGIDSPLRVRRDKTLGRLGSTPGGTSPQPWDLFALPGFKSGTEVLRARWNEGSAMGFPNQAGASVQA